MDLALSVLFAFVLATAAILFVAAAISDFRFYRIPNVVTALLAVIFPAFVLASPHSIPWLQHLAVFALMSIAGTAAFLGKFLGAGDVKLLAVASLWAGPTLIAPFLVTTALAGGVVSLIAGLATLKNSPAGPTAKADWFQAKVPYGIAIAAGGLSMLGLMAKSVYSPG